MGAIEVDGLLLVRSPFVRVPCLSMYRPMFGHSFVLSHEHRPHDCLSVLQSIESMVLVVGCLELDSHLLKASWNLEPRGLEREVQDVHLSPAQMYSGLSLASCAILFVTPSI